MFVGLVRSPEWRPPDDEQPPPRQRRRVPWKALLWVAAWCWAMALVPAVDHALGAGAGYVYLLLTVSVGVWRLERVGTGPYLRGLRDYQA